MMNYIAYYIVFYAVLGPFAEPTWENALTPPIPSAAWMPKLFPSPSLVDAGLIIGLIAAPLVYLFLKKTTLGYKIRIVGESREIARVQGFRISRLLIVSMLISGGMAGLAGMIQISGGISHRLTPGFSSTAGWAAIFATLLASRNPLGLILYSILYASLIVGARTMAFETGIPVYMSTVLQALVVLFVFVSQNIGLVKRYLSRF
jgi:simple sugar transport system permease protein